MDHQRERIQADLRGLLEGEVHCDDLFVGMYATDASLYEVSPLGVVRPRSAQDVVACVAYAREHGLSLHPRGAGSGLAGESLGQGLVLDFSASMRQIIRIDENQVRVQPGLVLAELNRRLAERGRLFGPDPATRSVTTMGSVLALDGSGSHWLQYGSARHKVKSLQVVLGTGELVELGRHAQEDPASESPAPVNQVVRRLLALFEERRESIDGYPGRALVDRCGYHVRDIVRDGHIDLAQLMVGSEGTLGIITEATLITDRIPAHRGVLLLFFNRIQDAARAAQEVVRQGASTCDLLDRRLITIARESDPAFERLLPREAEALLLVEHHGETLDEVRQHLRLMEQRLVRRRRLAFAARLALEREERDLYWRLARRVVPRLYRIKGATRPVPFVEDIAIPPHTLPDFIERAQNVLKTHQVTATLFAHAGHGQVHLRPFLDPSNPEHQVKMRDLANDLYAAVLEFHGTISGEHGTGLSRSWFLRRQFGPMYEVLREVKRIFDPDNVLNPGKVVGSAPQPLTKNLRSTGASLSLAAPPAAQGVDNGPVPGQDADQDAAGRRLLPLLVWGEDEMRQAATACNGCGRCRTQAADERMCPTFRLSLREEASPRAKANLMRALISGRLAPKNLTSDEMKRVADLCVHCHQCRVECPASVDIPKLMAEVKAQYAVSHGMPARDLFFARLERWLSLASFAAPLVNWALANRQFRWLLEKLVGVAQGRKLPPVAHGSFLRSARRQRLSRVARHAGRKVAYFVDTYANLHDVQLAQALVAVMEHNGIEVYVPQRQVASGMTPLSLGAVDRARKLAHTNVRVLAEAVRQGYEIVTTEPSAAMCLQHEYPSLLSDEDARLVAAHSSDACYYLWRLHQAGRFELDFRPLHVTLGYHVPCHARALPGGAAGEELLRLIPGVILRRLEHGCSGMAGVFGVKRENYRASLRIGRELIQAMRNPALIAGATTCGACKLQMEQGTTKPTVHPIKLLALAYRRAPDLEDMLELRSGELLVT